MNIFIQIFFVDIFTAENKFPVSFKHIVKRRLRNTIIFDAKTKDKFLT